MDELRDTELVKQALGGNSDSYGRLVDLHGRAVFAVACSRTGDYFSSEDIAQDAFLLAYERLATLRRPQDFGPWVRAIARNLSRRWQRNRAYRLKLQEDTTAVRERLGYVDETSPLQKLAREETQALLQAAHAALPRQEREALFLYYFQNQSVGDAAVAAEISEAAMRKRLQRARARLRDHMAMQVESELESVVHWKRLPALVGAGLRTGSSIARFGDAAFAAPSEMAWLATRWMARLTQHPWLPAAGLVAFAVSTALIFNIAESNTGIGRPAAIPAPVALRLPDPVPAAPTETPRVSAPLRTASSHSVPGSTIRGAVASATDAAESASVSGTVRDPYGAPVAGVKVEALLSAWEYGIQSDVRKVAAQTTSDSRGAYALTGIPPTTNSTTVLAMGTAWADGGRNVEPLKAGARRTGVDLALQKPATVRGQVVDFEDHPIEGATVVVGGVTPFDGAQKDKTPRDELWFSMAGCGGYARTTTDANGRFTFDRIPAGWALDQVGAFKTGYALGYVYSEESYKRRELELASGHGTGWSGYRIPPPWGELRVRLSPGGAVSGRVLATADGRPVSGARVTVEATDNAHGMTDAMAYRALVTADATGAFLVSDVPAKEASLQAHAAPLVSDVIKVALAPGRPLENVELPVGQSCTIEGAVIDEETGRPCPDAALHFMKKNVSGAMNETSSDEHGHYHISGLPAGSWAVAPRGWTLDKSHHPDAQEMWGVTVVLESEGETKQLDLYRQRTRKAGEPASPSKMTGCVLNASGKAVEGASVRVIDQSLRAETDQSGRFEILGVASGSQHVTAMDPATMTFGVVDVDVLEGRETTADITLAHAGARISGRLVDDEGKPFRKPVEIGCSPPTGGERMISREDGTYTTGPIKPGRYTLRPYASQVGCRIDSAELEITVEAGEDSTGVDFVLHAMKGFLTGTVTLRDGSPASYVDVRASTENEWARSRTGADGQFRVGPIDGDDLRLDVGNSGSSLLTITEHLKAGTENLKVVLDSTGTLKGRLVVPANDAQNAYLVAVRDSYLGSGLELKGAEFQGEVAAGVYRINVGHGSRQRTFGPYTVTPGKTTDVGTLDTMSTVGSVAGSVLKNGRAATMAYTQALVSLRAAETPEAETTVAATVEPKGGTYRMEAVGAGRYSVTLTLVNEKGWRSFSQSVKLSVGTETRVDFSLPDEQAALSGNVDGLRESDTGKVFVGLFEPGKRCIRGGERADLNAAANGALALLVVAPDGGFAGNQLPPGSFEIALLRMDHGVWNAPVCAKVELADDKPAVVRLAVAP